ncbi:hypothetical protein NXS19_005590 [Fusarium pseudograminearum]|nr:hypothetical protein NXS19_005590 [Fusarium pseudograminearum]
MSHKLDKGSEIFAFRFGSLSNTDDIVVFGLYNNGLCPADEGFGCLTRLRSKSVAYMFQKPVGGYLYTLPLVSYQCQENKALIRVNRRLAPVQISSCALSVDIVRGAQDHNITTLQILEVNLLSTVDLVLDCQEGMSLAVF